MADDVDDQDMSFAEGETDQAAAPKPKGAGPGILKILMVVGIALGAVILIVTVVVVTVGIMNKQQKPMAAVPVTESYQVATPIFAYSTNIGEIRAKTKDKEPASVLVKINLGFEENDKVGPEELQKRMLQVRDKLRNFFSMKYAADLLPEQEVTLKAELREELNHILAEPAIKEVLFEELTVVQM